jgi:hypothetical protein
MTFAQFGVFQDTNQPVVESMSAFDTDSHNTNIITAVWNFSSTNPELLAKTMDLLVQWFES